MVPPSELFEVVVRKTNKHRGFSEILQFGMSGCINVKLFEIVRIATLLAGPTKIQLKWYLRYYIPPSKNEPNLILPQELFAQAPFVFRVCKDCHSQV